MINKATRKTIALFSGGKDSMYALQAYLKKYPVDLIVSISSSAGDAQLHAGPETTGPIRIAQLQALDLPYKQIIIGSDKSYLHDLFFALKKIVTTHKITHLVTGDLWHPYTSGIGDMLAGSLGIELIRPSRDKCQKKEDGQKFMKLIIKSGIQAVVISVRKGNLPKEMVSKTIDQNFIQELITRNIDPTGESGEYQSLVFDAPIMKQRIILDETEIELVDGKNMREQFHRLRIKNFHTEQK